MASLRPTGLKAMPDTLPMWPGQRNSAPLVASQMRINGLPVASCRPSGLKAMPEPYAKTLSVSSPSEVRPSTFRVKRTRPVARSQTVWVRSMSLAATALPSGLKARWMRGG